VLPELIAVTVVPANVTLPRAMTGGQGPVVKFIDAFALNRFAVQLSLT